MKLSTKIKCVDDLKKVRARKVAQGFSDALDVHWATRSTGSSGVTACGITLTRHGDMAVSDIATAEVLKAIEPIWLEKNETANRVRARIEAILYAAKTDGHRAGDNPARWEGHLENRLQKRKAVKKTKHHKAIPYPEMPAFMVELRNKESISVLAQGERIAHVEEKVNSIADGIKDIRDCLMATGRIRPR